MAVCCCSLAGTAACNHCSQNPFATEVWTNTTVTTDHIEANPFVNGIDVCPVCGKPSTIGKPQTNADRIRAMADEELAIALYAGCSGRECPEGLWDKPLTEDEEDSLCLKCTIAWLKAPVEVQDGT